MYETGIDTKNTVYMRYLFENYNLCFRMRVGFPVTVERADAAISQIRLDPINSIIAFDAFELQTGFSLEDSYRDWQSGVMMFGFGPPTPIFDSKLTPPLHAAPCQVSPCLSSCCLPPSFPPVNS